MKKITKIILIAILMLSIGGIADSARVPADNFNESGTTIYLRETTDNLCIGTSTCSTKFNVVGTSSLSHIVPYITDTYRLGNSSYEWSGLWVDDITATGTTTLSTTTISGSLTVSGTLYLSGGISASADIDMNYYNIYEAGYVSAEYFNASSSATTSKFYGGLTVTGTSTIATSTLTGDLTINTDQFVIDRTNDRIGLSSSTPYSTFSVVGSTFLEGITTTTDLYLTSLTSGRVPFITASGQFTDDSNFTFNSANDELTIIGLATTYSTTTHATTSNLYVSDLLTLNNDLLYTHGGTGTSTAPDDNIMVGTGSAWLGQLLPDCDDSSGNHLNYDTTANKFTCGTSGGLPALTDTYILVGNQSNIAEATSSLVVDTNGRLGIASTSPKHILSIVGNGFIEGDLTVTGTFSPSSISTTNFTTTYSTTTHATTTNLYVGTLLTLANDLLYTHGGTGTSTAPDDTVLVGTGSAWAGALMADCDDGSGFVNYDTATNAFSCGTSSPMFGSSIDDSEMTAEDFGEFTCTGGEDGCTIDADTIAAAEMADADHGDVAWSSGTASVQDLTISSEANGDILYFNGSNWVRLGTSTDGYVLTLSNDIPAWAAGGSGDVTDVGDCTTGACFDGASGNVLKFEGTVEDVYELSVSAAELGDSYNWIFPDDQIADNDAIVGTGAGTFGYTAIPDCDDSGGQHLNYDTTAGTFSCGTTALAGGMALTDTYVLVGNQSNLAEATSSLVILTDGKVGIASTTPKHQLGIVGNIFTEGNITSSGSFVIGSADMNETDLEKLDGITNGTAAANKALVLDASSNIGTIGVLTTTGLLTTYSTTTHATTTNFYVSGTLNLPNDSILDAMIDWGNLTDLNAGGEVAWGNITAGELADNSIIDADIDDDGNFTFTGTWDFSGGDIVLAGTSVDAGTYAAASIDGDDVNSNIAGRSLTLTGASPDTLDIDAEIYTESKCIYFEDPTADDDFNSIWRTTKAVTITEVWCDSDQTIDFDLQEDDGSPADIIGVDLQCATTENSTSTAFSDASIAANSEIDLVVTSVANTPTWVSICFTYTKDD